MKKRRYPLSGVCLGLSALLFAFGAAEAMVRWDAMAPLIRIIINLISYGKLTAGEIWNAVRPEIAGCLYPLCAVMCALCGAVGMLSARPRAGGALAAAAYLAAGTLNFLAGGGTVLGGLHLLRGVLLLLAGCLFVLRIVLPRRKKRKRARGGETKEKKEALPAPAAVPPPLGSAGGERAGSAERLREAEEGRHLFAPRERRPLFGRERERVPLFDHRGRRGSGAEGEKDETGRKYG